jgi:hypothetical protein
VRRLITWKHSFRKLSEENEMAKKKKQALDNLLSSGRISQSTYESINTEISEAIAEIEKQQHALLEKMNSKMAELEGQIKTLEMLLANSEIQHVAGELEDEAYQREINLLLMGLDAARHELNAVKDAVSQLSTIAQVPAPDIVVEQKVEAQPKEYVEISRTEIKMVEEPVVEPIKAEASETSQQQPQEQVQNPPEPQPTDASAEGESKQETQQ